MRTTRHLVQAWSREGAFRVLRRDGVAVARISGDSRSGYLVRVLPTHANAGYTCITATLFRAQAEARKMTTPRPRMVCGHTVTFERVAREVTGYSHKGRSALLVREHEEWSVDGKVFPSFAYAAAYAEENPLSY